MLNFTTNRKQIHTDMKKIVLAFCALATLSVNAQIQTPQPSPAGKVSQSVGLNTIDIEYSRPLKRDRVIFGDLVPYDQMWRTGANKNSMITTSDIMIFGNDTLQAGTYAIFTKPMKGKSWEVYFYTDTENWGTPEKWDDAKVAVKAMAMVTSTSNVTESFTIGIDNVDMDAAELSFAWDKTRAAVSFKVPTDERVRASIDAVMAGPSSADYYKAADYYLAQGIELETALQYMNKSLAMRDDQPFWYLRKKALIQAELGDYKGAIETAKLSLEGAKKANYDSYIKSNEESIAEWTKKLK